MKKRFTYKQVLAALLLLLYTFVATPVQLWHDHNTPSQKESSQKGSTASVDTKSENCKICQHTYSAYFADEVFLVFNHFSLLSIRNPLFKEGYENIYLNRLSNKGPPLV